MEQVLARRKKDKSELSDWVVKIVESASGSLHPADIAQAIRHFGGMHCDQTMVEAQVEKLLRRRSPPIKHQGKKRHRIQRVDQAVEPALDLYVVGRWSEEDWSRDELLQVCELFKALDGVGITETNDAIVKLADEIGRRVRQVEAQALMFRPMLDPDGKRWSTKWNKASDECHAVFALVYGEDAGVRSRDASTDQAKQQTSERKGGQVTMAKRNKKAASKKAAKKVAKKAAKKVRKTVAKKAAKKSSASKKKAASTRASASTPMIPWDEVIAAYEQLYEDDSLFRVLKPTQKKPDERRFALKSVEQVAAFEEILDAVDGDRDGIKKSFQKQLLTVHLLHVKTIDPTQAQVLIKGADVQLEEAWSKSQLSKKIQANMADYPKRTNEWLQKNKKPDLSNYSSALGSRKTGYKSISDYLKVTDHIEIPPYQRSYVWQKRQIDDLFADVSSLEFEVDPEIRFLGSILLQRKPTDSSRFYLLDGQQRSVTISVLIAIACELFWRSGYVKAAKFFSKNYLFIEDDPEDKWVPKLIPERQDQSAYAEILKASVPPNTVEFDFKVFTADLTKAGQGGVKSRGKDIREQLEGRGVKNGILTQPDSLFEFLAKLLHLSAVCRFELAKQDDPFETFQRLNWAGTKLTNADLLRAVVYGIAQESGLSEAKMEEFTKKWQGLEDEIEARSGDGEVSHHNKSRKDYFFTAFAKTLDPTIKKKSTVRDLSVRWKREKKTADAIREQVTDAVPRYNLLVDYSDAACQSASHVMKALDSKERGWLLVLSRLGVSQEVVPLLMNLIKARSQGGKTTPSKSESIRLLEFLASWFVRKHACTGVALQGLQGMMSKAASCLDARDPVKELFKVIDKRDQRLGSLTDDAFETALFDPIYSRKELTRAILFRIDLDDLAFGKQQPNSGNSDGRIKSDIEIEHVCPQKLPTATQDWGEWRKENLHATWRDCLGNLILCEQPINAALKQKPWADKKVGYAGSSVSIARELGRNVERDSRWVANWNSQWGPELVEDRTKDLARKVVSLFPFPSVASNFK
ncbi:DUF262 domain-containing HNH endonuclease family protein [bacterium]|nr:DUF262 domain-containing HNH endonuclease family protein [bacterium]